jgi:hypothetical protein
MKPCDTDKVLSVWTMAYIFKADRWPQERAMRYADRKAIKYRMHATRAIRAAIAKAEA